MAPISGDADLLALCAQLRVLQSRWQRLWSVAAENAAEGDDTPADMLLDRYAAWVWPGTMLADLTGLSPVADPVRRLLDLPATTPEGLQAKAAAILALHDVGDYLDCDRTDQWQIMASVLRDAAGAAAMPLGKAFIPIAQEPGPMPAP